MILNSSQAGQRLQRGSGCSGAWRRRTKRSPTPGCCRSQEAARERVTHTRLQTWVSRDLDAQQLAAQRAAVREEVREEHRVGHRVPVQNVTL